MDEDEIKFLLQAFESEKYATETSGPGNPPSWVAEESKWSKAKEVSKSATGSVSWPFVTWYYLNKLNGGRR